MNNSNMQNQFAAFLETMANNHHNGGGRHGGRGQRDRSGSNRKVPKNEVHMPLMRFRSNEVKMSMNKAGLITVNADKEEVKEGFGKGNARNGKRVTKVNADKEEVKEGFGKGNA